MRSASIGTFIDTTNTFIVASYPENLPINVKPDDPVDIAFKITPVPGRIEVKEFDYRGENVVIYQENGITVRSWPATHR